LNIGPFYKKNHQFALLRLYRKGLLEALQFGAQPKQKIFNIFLFTCFCSASLDIIVVKVCYSQTDMSGLQGDYLPKTLFEKNIEVSSETLLEKS
jgi:hypothetical protein